LVIAINPKDPEVAELAEGVYAELQEAGVEVLYDDRPERAGVKFKDADLVGIPVRVVIGKKALAEGKVEISLRRDRERRMVERSEVVATVRQLTAGREMG
jgi:prolyl-tRNA synthetase